MESLTKNHQSKERLAAIVKACFPDTALDTYRELKEGYFNAAYDVLLQNGQTLILKIAPPKHVPIMSYEKNIMFSEVEAMRMVSAYSDIPSPKIYAYDNSCTICPSPYFFMEKLPGNSVHALSDTLTAEEKQAIQVQAGQINRKINEITCPYFGLPGQPQVQGESWYPVFCQMLELGISDAKARNIDLKISIEQLLYLLQRDASLFEEVKEPQLVHWDLWDGNIFIKDGTITGLIDWERCVFGDPLMEVGFRTYKDNAAFQKGYGIECLTDSQRCRALWYDIYHLILCSLECEYRQYDTMNMYEWATGLLQKQFQKLSV
ncbi:MAG: phosphotransferase [bacterium]|nr:phosphotransferase [bacterium]